MEQLMPSVIGMPAMDAIALLENLQVKLNVKLNGNGVIRKQSVDKHEKLHDEMADNMKAMSQAKTESPVDESIEKGA